MDSCFVLIGTHHEHYVAKLPQHIGPCSQAMSNLDPNLYTEALATSVLSRPIILPMATYIPRQERKGTASSLQDRK